MAAASFGRLCAGIACAWALVGAMEWGDLIVYILVAIAVLLLLGLILLRHLLRKLRYQKLDYRGGTCIPDHAPLEQWRRACGQSLRASRERRQS
jgi:TRAP-type mannitol/chloroaromatic compound transport system permease large subunit